MANIIKAEKATLARLDTGALAETIDRFVRNAQERQREAFVAWKFAAPEDKRKALARLEDANKSLEDYLDEQKELFAARGMNKERAFKEAIVPTGETTAAGVEIYRIVKRGESLNPAEAFEDAVYAEDERMMNEMVETETDADWDAQDTMDLYGLERMHRNDDPRNNW